MQRARRLPRWMASKHLASCCGIALACRAYGSTTIRESRSAQHPKATSNVLLILNRQILMKIAITGSIAYDYLMTYPGEFAEMLRLEGLNKISVSFLVDEMTKHQGGVAPNIAYTLTLLGER